MTSYYAPSLAVGRRRIMVEAAVHHEVVEVDSSSPAAVKDHLGRLAVVPILHVVRPLPGKVATPMELGTHPFCQLPSQVLAAALPPKLVSPLTR